MKLKVLVTLSLITVISSLNTAARAQSFSVLHAFAGELDGAAPQSGVTLRGGALYGTTFAGGDTHGFNFGTVYQVTLKSRIYAPIFSFPLDGAGGIHPVARVVFGPDGHLYGTAAGFDQDYYEVVVFELVPPSSICRTTNCPWTENVIDRPDLLNDAISPGYGDLVWDQEGNIYGVASGNSNSVGNVYELAKSEHWKEMPIHSFTGYLDGAEPLSGVILGHNGALFGTTAAGGSNSNGTVFELSYVDGRWVENVIHNFQGSDGDWPKAGLISDSSGNLYGATAFGGNGGGGVLFELSPSDNTWIFQVLHEFSGTGCGPAASLTMDPSGDLYGTTYCDGLFHHGNVFKLSNTSNGWEYASLYDFTGGSDGGTPMSQVTIDTDGTLYGTTSLGGDRGCSDYGCGVVWMIKP